MARFSSELPNDLMKEIEKLNQNSEKMFGEMCKSGAQVVYNNVIKNMGGSFKTTKSLKEGLRITRAYKTPSDDGINSYVGFYGYDSEGIPIPLKAQAREYGTSRGEDKKPFFRKSFKKKDIEMVMMVIQHKYIKGD